MKKVAVIAALVLLAAGITVYAQTANRDRQTREGEAPSALDGSVRCGGPRGDYDGGDFEGNFGTGGYGGGNGFGGGYGCH